MVPPLQYVQEEGLYNPQHHSSTLSRDLDDLFALLCKFFFQYRSIDDLVCFLLTAKRIIHDLQRTVKENVKLNTQLSTVDTYTWLQDVFSV